MTHEQFEKLKDSGRLPSLCPAGAALHHMKRRGECVDAEVIEALAEDPALTELVLRLANTARPKDAAEVETIDEYVAREGALRVRSVGLGFAIVLCNRAGVCEQLDYDGFWSLALARATAAQILGAELAAADAIEAFLCGLLARTGGFVLGSVFPKEYAGLLRVCPAPSEVEMRRLERGLFGLDHHQATLALLDHYGLPARFLEAIAAADGTHRITSSDEPLEGLEGMLEVGDQLARILVEDLGVSRHCWYDLVSLRQRLQLDRDTFHLLGDRVAEEWGEWGDLLRVPTKPVPSFNEIALYEIGASADEEAALRSAMAEPVPAPEEEKLRILAVDDDPLTLRLLSRHLELGGYHVFTATNGREALLSALHNDPHVVVADWMMPEMDGIELCKALRRFDAGRRIFFILLTGREEEDKVVEAFEAGVDDFVSKPFRSKLFRARIRASERVIQLQRQVEVDKRLLRENLAEKSALSRKLQAAAFTDVLTELPNRRYLIKRLAEEWASTERAGEPLSVVMLDIDHFKRVNDAHGHDVGDTVLRATAGVLEASTRRGESACRLGGEEFLVICSGSGIEEALACGERIRAAVESNVIRDGSFSGNVTVSVGVAYRDEHVVDMDNLLRLADEAVYRAKSRGRNRVVAWTADPELREAG